MNIFHSFMFVSVCRRCCLVYLLVFEVYPSMSFIGWLTKRRAYEGRVSGRSFQRPCDTGTRLVCLSRWEVAALLPQMAARAVQASKELLARLPSWRLLFQGRYLVVTNTVGGGVLMAVGDSLQQTREMHMEVGRVRDWRRTGERGEVQTLVSSAGPSFLNVNDWLIYMTTVSLSKGAATDRSFGLSIFCPKNDIFHYFSHLLCLV